MDHSADQSSDPMTTDPLLGRLFQVGADRQAERSSRRYFAAFGPIGVALGAFLAATPLAPALVPVAAALAIGGPATALLWSGGVVSTRRARRARARAIDAALTVSPPQLDRAIAVFEYGRTLDDPRHDATAQAAFRTRLNATIDAMYDTPNDEPIFMLAHLPDRVAAQVHELMADSVPQLALEVAPHTADALAVVDDPTNFANAQLALVREPTTVYLGIAMLTSAVEQSPDVAAHVVRQGQEVHRAIGCYPRAASAFAQLVSAAHTRISEELADDDPQRTTHERSAHAWAAQAQDRREPRFIADL